MYVGVDGCRAGWIAVSGSVSGLKYAVFGTIHELMQAHRTAELILIDIPIGLPDARCPRRPCDLLARKLLGSRAASVFPAPCRSAAHAENIAEARRLNIVELDVSLSAQAWGICQKIAEVDRFLLVNPDVRETVREMHPEVCFWSLNGMRPMRFSKKTRGGIAERLARLEEVDARAGGLYQRVIGETMRKDVQRDDVLDALVGCLTGMAMATGSLSNLSGTPACDGKGLPMEMVYRKMAPP
jgi:predicted RNase H-like nuclease